jgi:gliding motility-associated-like protein
MKRVSYRVFFCFFIFLPALAIGQPVSNFTANVISGCSPIIVQFTDQSTGNPASWSWNLGNSTTSTLQNPSTTYFTPGTYTVSLTVTNASGSNTKTITNYITVFAPPTVNFSGDSTVTCPPKNVQFTNLTTPGSSGSTSYLWDFGDGNTSTQINPNHTYTTVGNYNVSLIVTNSNGCTKSLTKTGYISLIQKPGTNFTATSVFGCTAPLTTNFSNATTNGATYNWDFGDGGSSTQTNPSHTYTSTGSYNVRLIATNTTGCTDTIIKNGFVNIGNLHASFTTSPSTKCSNKDVVFTNTTTPSSGTTYAWDFGDGGSTTQNSPLHSYIASGTYTVRLIASNNGCNDTSLQNIIVVAGPNIQFTTADSLGCSTPFSAQFANSSTNASSYLWIFGDGGTSTQTNPSHTYSSFGNYTVKLVATNSNGCTDTITKANLVKLQPASILIVGNGFSGCAPSTGTLTAVVMSSLFPVTNYTWNFGDGSPPLSCSTCYHPTHTYVNPGSYYPSYTITTGSCTFTTGGFLFVASKPTAGFNITPSTVCPNTPVYVTNTSSGATNYIWLSGGVPISTKANDSFSFKSGTVTVTLVASNSGCNDTLSKTITVNLPRAAFTTSYSCSNRLNISFTDNSQGANTYFWNFGDGNTSTTPGNVSHTYGSYGVYNVKLGVKNNATGCTDTAYVTINLAPLTPQFTANKTAICPGDSITYNATASSIYTKYKWAFGDGGALDSTINVVKHTYTTPGNYSVKLIIADSAGCKDSLVKTNYVHVGGATVNFSASSVSGCLPLAVNFTDLSTPNGGFGIKNRLWDFGDATSTNTTNNTISHNYTATGTYTVTLIVTDSNDCVTLLAKPAYIIVSHPTAAFSTIDTNACKGQNISFANASTGSNPTYSWNFGDGGISTLANPTHAYSVTGSYTVKLLVTDSIGCKDSITKIAYIHINAPTVNFNMSANTAPCPPLTVNFTNTSSGATNYNWTMANGGQSTLANPTTVYTYPGVYNVKLIGQNASGCKDSATKTVTVYGPTGTFSYTPLAGCAPLTISFTAATNNTTSLIWDLNNGYTQTTTSNTLSYTYTQSGKYLPKLILSDNASCLVPIQGIDTIKVDHLDADFSFSPNSLCYSGTVQFTDTVLTSLTGIVSRNWTFGDGGTSTAHNPSHPYIAPGNYTVRLVIGNAQGCLDTIIKIIKVNALPNVTAGPNQAICQGQATPITLTATGAATYSWSPTTGLSCTNCASPTVLPSSTITYIVTRVDTNGCTDTGIVTITVNPKPVINAGNSQTICAGSSAQLLATGGNTYVWSPATGLSCINCNNPVASPTATTTYKVTGTNNNGCSDSAFVTVTVNPLPIVSAGTNKIICAGSSVQLQATGANTYSWSPSGGLSCVNCANPVASPFATSTYTVTGTNNNGCINTSTVTVTVNQKPNVSAGTNQNICAGSSITLTATGATSYSWAPTTGLSCINCASPAANPTATITYTVTGTDNNGCTNTASVTVTVNPIPQVTAAGSKTICPGDTSQLLATGATNYFWSPSTGLSCTVCPNPIASPTTTIVYKVTGTTNGCSDSAFVTITVRPAPSISTNGNKSICIGNSVNLNANGAISYTWSPATGLSCINCPNPIASPITTTTYALTGKDSAGCSGTTNITVTIHPSPNVDAGPDQTICEGTATQLNATGAQNYSWSPAANLSCTNCNNPVANPTNNISYKVVGIDINGCRDSDEIAISVIHKLPVSINSGDTICLGDSAQLSVSGGSSYIWLPSNGLDNPQSATPIASPSATTNYSVIIKQGDCFADTGHVVVFVNPVPSVDAGPDASIVIGNSITLHAISNDNVKYKWTPAEALSCTDCPSPVATPKATSDYIVTVTNQWGCTSKDNITIFVSCDGAALYIPNTFTPNEDGVNDRFYPQGKGVAAVNRFSVYNRWGQLVFEARNMPLNDPLAGWDGTYKSERLKPDVFVYILNASCPSGEPIEIKGDISLIH